MADNNHQHALPDASPPGWGFRWHWFRPVVDWFFCYPLLFLLAAGLLMILLAVQWDPIGANRLGLSGLFWHKSTWMQWKSGLGAALLLGVICLNGYLLDSRAKWLRRRWSGGGEDPLKRSAWSYFFVSLTFPGLVLLAALPAVFDIANRWALPLGLFAGGVVVGLLTWFGRSLHPESSGLFDWMLSLPRLRQEVPAQQRRLIEGRRLVLLLNRETRGELAPFFHLHALQLFLSLLLGVVYLLLWLAASYSPDWVSPALVICVLLALATVVYGFVVFHFPKRHFGVFALMVAGLIMYNSLSNPRYRYDGLDYDNPIDLTDRQAIESTDAGLLNNVQVLEAWRDGLRRNASLPKPVLVIVAVKGGGARSAAWTTAVLTKLEAAIRGFPYHVRLISGVSGGMLGATYYVTTLNPPGAAPPHAAPDEMADVISQDSLSPVVRHLALPLRGDRGQALEAAWEKNTDGALSAPFFGLRAKEGQGWCPSLVYSPMMLEDGRRLLISNLNLDFLAHNNGHLLAQRKTEGIAGQSAKPSRAAQEYSVSGVQFFQLFPGARHVRISTIARMNATFPYISPDAELATIPRRRVVDAAYYDRYGVNLAALWIDQFRAWIREHTAGVVLIQIRDRPRKHAKLADEEETRGSPLGRAVDRFTAPLQGAVRARDATMSFRNDELLSMLDRYFNAPLEGDARDDFFTTVVFEFPERAPLSWYLPTEDLRRIKDAVADETARFAGRLRLLKNWWERRQGKAEK